MKKGFNLLSVYEECERRGRLCRFNIKSWLIDECVHSCCVFCQTICSRQRLILIHLMFHQQTQTGGLLVSDFDRFRYLKHSVLNSRTKYPAGKTASYFRYWTTYPVELCKRIRTNLVSDNGLLFRYIYSILKSELVILISNFVSL